MTTGGQKQSVAGRPRLPEVKAVSVDERVLGRLEELRQMAGHLARTTHRESSWGDCVDVELYQEWGTSCLSLLQRVFGDDSPHYDSFRRIYGNNRAGVGWGFSQLRGVLAAAIADYSGGYLRSLTSLVTAELFADFLEMAEYLLSEGYKDAAAVLIGGVLEEHLRKLSTANGIPLTVADQNGKQQPKKAESLNSELAGQAVYSKLDQKSVTSWLDLRNKAAHGKFSEYELRQVQLMSQGVADFASRNPA